MREREAKEGLESRMHLSRRTFLRGAGFVAAGSALTDPSLPGGGAKAAAPAVLGPGPVRVTLKVNGHVRSLYLEPRMTLAEVLRGPLNLEGTKIACNRGACSACTVWLDGAPVCACMTLAVDVGARSVTTIEGLSSGGALHPVQRAFIEYDAMQCGFCTPGLVMSTAALIASKPEPNVNDVKIAISGHLCRCGSYPKIVAATLAAAKRRE